MASNLMRPEFFPRGVANRDAALGCTANAGVMYGLHLQTGRLRWRTAAARRPLLIHANRLFAAELAAGQANILRVRSLDLEDPKRNLRPTIDIVFPPWVDVADADTFALDVYGADEEVVFQWQARRRYRGGAPPPAAILHALPRELMGTARVHIVSGTVEMTSHKPAADVGYPATSLKTISFKMASRHSEETWRFKELQCALTVAEHMGKQQLTLHRQATDGTDMDVALCPVDAGVPPQVTRDGGFVLAWTAQIPQEQQGSRGCAVFRTDTGSPVATVVVNPEAEDPCVIEPHLYCISANTLIALDLDREETAWSWPFPLSRSNGPPPLRR